MSSPPPPPSPKWWSASTIAVVTGANKGIGLEIVRRLALQGLTVILTSRDRSRGLQATQSLQSQGLSNVLFHQLDIGSSESRTAFAEWIQGTYGGLDILVNNAAVFHNTTVYEDAVETMRVNYRGTVELTELLLPLLRGSSAAGARVVNVSSIVGRLTVRRRDPHCLVLLSCVFCAFVSRCSVLPVRIKSLFEIDCVKDRMCL